MGEEAFRAANLPTGKQRLIFRGFFKIAGNKVYKDAGKMRGDFGNAPDMAKLAAEGNVNRGAL